MQARYESRFEKLEKQRAALFERVASLEAELLSRSPGEGEWSVAQVATHLAGAERRSLEYIRKKTQDPSRLWSAGLGAAARSLALTAALRSPLRFSVPPSVPEPAEHADWDVARREWDDRGPDETNWARSYRRMGSQIIFMPGPTPDRYLAAPLQRLSAIGGKADIAGASSNVCL